MEPLLNTPVSTSLKCGNQLCSIIAVSARDCLPSGPSQQRQLPLVRPCFKHVVLFAWCWLGSLRAPVCRLPWSRCRSTLFSDVQLLEKIGPNFQTSSSKRARCRWGLLGKFHAASFATAPASSLCYWWVHLFGHNFVEIQFHRPKFEILGLIQGKRISLGMEEALVAAGVDSIRITFDQHLPNAHLPQFERRTHSTRRKFGNAAFAHGYSSAVLTKGNHRGAIQCHRGCTFQRRYWQKVGMSSWPLQLMWNYSEGTGTRITV